MSDLVTDNDRPLCLTCGKNLRDEGQMFRCRTHFTADLKSLKAEREKLRAELKLVKAERATARAERNKHLERGAALEAKLAAARAEIERLRGEVIKRNQAFVDNAPRGLLANLHSLRALIRQLVDELDERIDVGEGSIETDDLIARARAAIEPITPGVGT